MILKDGRVTTTREEMKAIKRQDHRQIDDTLTKVYQVGVSQEKESRAAAQEALTEAVMETLQEIKGIGEKRREEFVATFARKIREKTGIENGASIRKH